MANIISVDRSTFTLDGVSYPKIYSLSESNTADEQVILMNIHNRVILFNGKLSEITIASTLYSTINLFSAALVGVTHN